MQERVTSKGIEPPERATFWLLARRLNIAVATDDFAFSHYPAGQGVVENKVFCC